MEWCHIFCIFGALVIYSGAQSISSPSPSYLISAPKVLRPKVSTTLSVTVLIQSDVRVIAEIVSGNTSVVRTENTFHGGSTGLQVLPPIPDSAISHFSPYKLVVRGYVDGGLVFTNASYLRFNPKSFSTFVQTDKSIYSPGQMVKIRTVSIYLDGKPCKSKVDIVIKDPKRNMIRQWLALDGFLGVVSREFQLSEHPPLGVWTIEASVDEVVSEKKFTVDYHVLPKFEVQIKAPTEFYYQDNLTGIVTTQYLYGKPVKGLLMVSAEFKHFGMPMFVNKTMTIDGSANFVFSTEDFNGLLIYDESKEMICLTAWVTESLTGLKYNTVIYVAAVGERYRLTFYAHPNTVKPYLNFSTQLKVSSYSGRPLTPEDQLQTVTLTVTEHRYSPWSWRQELWENAHPRSLNASYDPGKMYPHPLSGEDDLPSIKTVSHPVPASGIVPIWIQLSDDVETLNIEAQFQDITAVLELYSSYSSPSKSYIQISRGDSLQGGSQGSLSGSPAHVGIPLQLLLLSNFPLTKFHYLVISRGQVVAAGNKSSASFSLTPEESWAPQACVVVYCVLTDGEIVNDAMDIPIDLVLRNNVSLSWSRARAKPADQVTLSVSVTEPVSLVGILVVDKATKWPKGNNDITEEVVVEELAEYNGDKSQTPQSEVPMSDPYSVFKACNLMVLTDAMLFEMENTLSPQFPGEGVHYLDQDEEMGQEPRVRMAFPETWLWLETNISASTTADLPVTVPDSITSWIATAFVMSDNLGLGLVSVPAKLTVFQDFFLSLNLPPYVIRGEQLVLEVLLFNYLPQELEVLVIVAESESFEFLFLEAELSMASTQRVFVGSQDSTSVLFPIRPRTIGEMPIAVKAVSSISSDAVARTVLVKPEGIKRSFTKSLFLELAPVEHRLSREIHFTFPPDVVQGSERAEVTVVGDILGPSITGLDSLIQMPYGCGEQNMIHFAPNIYVLQYLTNTDQVKEDIRAKALSYMMEGYQRELSYQRDDGSFSAFGDSDPSGSTWLSAFVLRCFLQARPFISIDPGVLSRTAVWLAAQQSHSGAFTEAGRVIHTELQGGLDGPVALTAYVLTALLEDQTYANIYANAVSDGLAFLEAKLAAGISSNYSLCLATYALSLANHTSAKTALTELMTRAQMHGNIASWGSLGAELLKSWEQPRSADIEMAAYVLLSLFKLAMPEEGFPLMKWLSQQRNHLGGFGSTQDTVIALQALSWYAAFSGSDAIDLNVDVVPALSGHMVTFHIDSTNYLLRQSEEIETERNIDIEVFAEGRGFALFQLNVFYNLKGGGLSWGRSGASGQEAFDLHVEVTSKEGNVDHITVTVCTRLLENQGINQTGMALMEVGLLSGFILAQDGVETDDLIRRVETNPGQVVLYLDSLTTSMVCIPIPTVREFKVARVQDAVVLVYDYYDTQRKAERTYNSEALRDTSSCTFCGDDCSLCGGDRTRTSSARSQPGAARLLTGLLLLVLAATF